VYLSRSQKDARSGAGDLTLSAILGVPCHGRDSSKARQTGWDWWEIGEECVHSEPQRRHCSRRGVQRVVNHFVAPNPGWVSWEPRQIKGDRRIPRISCVLNELLERGALDRPQFHAMGDFCRPDGWDKDPQTPTQRANASGNRGTGKYLTTGWSGVGSDARWLELLMIVFGRSGGRCRARIPDKIRISCEIRKMRSLREWIT